MSEPEHSPRHSEAVPGISGRGRSAGARSRHPLAWVPSAYFAEGIPFAIVIWVAGTMFKDLGHSDGEITLATASIGLAWSLKPLWAAFLDMFKTKKFFVLGMEYLMAALLMVLALLLGLPNYFELSIGLLWVLAFSSATQDICIDGVYITSLEKKAQAAYIGVQGTCWNLGRLFSTAAIVWLAGSLQSDAGMPSRSAWAAAITLGALMMALLGAYHTFVLPVGSVARRARDVREIVVTFGDTLRDFFAKKAIWGMLLFVFLYRSGEGFLLVEAPLFLQAASEQGGAGLTLKEKGLIDGTISTGVSVLGGLLGGWFISRYGLKRSLFFMALCMNVPHLCFLYLSHAVTGTAPLSLAMVGTLVTIEKLGYSFGFTANMLYMMQQIAPGKYQMTHYAFCTALMNLVLIPTQMASGPLADALGYKAFFLFVMFASIPSLVAAWFAPFPDPPEPPQSDGEPVGDPGSSSGIALRPEVPA
jgi:MFS transporter, PAT family, beta-lactamase induction signal transducer AmpG